jgi:hypothetical protein
MELYQLTFDCCTAYPEPYSEHLLKGILGFLSEFCEGVRSEIVKSNTPVRLYAQKWKCYNEAALYTSRACEYLNRQLNQRADGSKSDPMDRLLRLSILSHAHLVWQTSVLLKLKNHNDNVLIRNLLDLIRDYRDGKEVPMDEIKTTIYSFLQLNEHSETPSRLYEEEFERPFVAATSDYYSSEAELKINTLPIQEYISYATERIRAEGELNTLLIPESSRTRIITSCDHEYITAHLNDLIKEFEKQILSENMAKCNVLYRLVSRVPEGMRQPLCVFEQHVLNCLTELVKSPVSLAQKEPNRFIEQLVELRERFLSFCQESFEGDPALEAALDKTFRSVLNDSNLNPHFHYPEGLSKYCDVLLKKGSKHAYSEQEVEEKLKKMLALFAYLDDKDLFQKFYARFLAKRLLYSSSISVDIELNIVSRLKELCGYEFTSKMQRMFTDVSLSDELVSEFHNQVQNLDCDFNAMILTSGSWPLPTDNFNNYRLPYPIERGITEFNSFYLNKLGRVGRKLNWNHHFSRGVSLLIQAKLEPIFSIENTKSLYLCVN